MYGDRRHSGGAPNPADNPPNSRLFIIGPKCLQEEDFRRAFSEFGHLEEVRAVKDRATGENKGVFYLKYSKTSSAAKAMEEMGGKVLGTGRSIKVMVASSRDQGSKREENEEERLQRLFVVVSRNMTDSELYDSFKEFGELDYAHIIRDRSTKESKGFAYVKFFKFSDAATAYENCDRKFKPVFAEPRRSAAETARSAHAPEPPRSRGGDSGGCPGRAGERFGGPPSLLLPPPPERMRDDGYTALEVVVNAGVNQDQMWRLFDVVPTMEYCTVRHDADHPGAHPTRAVAEVVYADARWAAHARDKLHGFEYPPGSRLIVRPDPEGGRLGVGGGGRAGGKRPRGSAEPPDLRRIAETIAHASSLIQAAGLSPDMLQKQLRFPETEISDIDTYCSAELPPPQPLVGIDTETEARCFIVCQPTPLSNRVLKDIFCRFGNLIDVYMLSNRNCGYACYASKFSAEEAILALHGVEVMGVRLKVIEAEERQGKRAKLDESLNQ